MTTLTPIDSIQPGLHAGAPILPDAESVTLPALNRAYYETWKPIGPVEIFLVDTMIEADWSRRRLKEIEAKLAAAPEDDPKTQKTIDQLFRRKQANLRNWHKAYHEMCKLRKYQAAVEKQVTQPPNHPAKTESAAVETPVRDRNPRNLFGLPGIEPIDPSALAPPLSDNRRPVNLGSGGER